MEAAAFAGIFIPAGAHQCGRAFTPGGQAGSVDRAAIAAMCNPGAGNKIRSVGVERHADRLVSLGEVAQILGVHPSTVRSWSNSGALPVHRTQGGHRRYVRSEVELWVQSQSANGSSEANLVVQNALKNTRFKISEGRLGEEAWYLKLDEEAREQYRKSGRTLMQGLIDYLSSDEEKAEAEAHALGYEYAGRGRRYGLSVADAANAFLFFRNVAFGSDVGQCTKRPRCAHPTPGATCSGASTALPIKSCSPLLETYDAYTEATVEMTRQGPARNFNRLGGVNVSCRACWFCCCSSWWRRSIVVLRCARSGG